MRVTARNATVADIDSLVRLYRVLEEEMVALHAMWPLADGLDEPVRDSLLAAIDRQDTHVILGEIDDYPFGFLVARVEGLLDQADG